MSAPYSPQPSAPDRDITVDFAIAVARLRQLGISVRHSSTVTAPTAVIWSEEAQTVYLRTDATFWAKLYVLAELLALHTTPGYVSPSATTARLTLVAEPADEPDPPGLPGESGVNHRAHQLRRLPLQRQTRRVLDPV